MYLSLVIVCGFSLFLITPAFQNTVCIMYNNKAGSELSPLWVSRTGQQSAELSVVLPDLYIQAPGQKAEPGSTFFVRHKHQYDQSDQSVLVIKPWGCEWTRNTRMTYYMSTQRNPACLSKTSKLDIPPVTMITSEWEVSSWEKSPYRLLIPGIKLHATAALNDSDSTTKMLH